VSTAALRRHETVVCPFCTVGRARVGTGKLKAQT
ncbi:uncharacterized protein METZ01_LOCUS86239, partial [marine metagenome]